MRIWSKILPFTFFFLCLLVSGRGEAALPEDFGCRGLYLGDGEEKMRQLWGEPLFTSVKNVLGTGVTYYWYGDGYEVGIGLRNETIVDIKIDNHKYKARDGVRYGATSYKIQKVFGPQKKRLIGGEMFYIYEAAGNKRERLVLKVDNEKGSLISFRITSLPLTIEEAEERMDDDIAAWAGEIEEPPLHFDGIKSP